MSIPEKIELVSYQPSYANETKAEGKRLCCALRPLLITLMLAVVLACCACSEDHPLLTRSYAQPITQYSSFDDYVRKVETLLSENRYFLTSDRINEVKANMPFELKPQDGESSQKGVLLIHGLGDSPWSFVDIGQDLARKGFLVRTVLLSGHGTRPADIIDADHNDWQKLVTRQVEILKMEVDDVYIGGFSTGGNLAYLYAAQDPDIKGLMLFSPGFQSDEPLTRFTPLLSFFRTWLLLGDPESETNYTRYTAMPTNGFAQYYQTSENALESLNKDTFERPIYMVVTEHDSVLDPHKMKTLFNERFVHPESRLMWFGSAPSGVSGRVVTVNSRVPKLRVSNMSHMGILFSPENPYYGIEGSERICRNGQEAPEAEEYCNDGNPVWYSAWGYQEESKVHARLTFNPAFDMMMDQLFTVFRLCAS